MEIMKMSDDQKAIIEKIIAERNRQDGKWGEQNHEPFTWLAILSEELGEVSKDYLEGNPDHAIVELIQAAAVIIAWIECQKRIWRIK